jgi:hypothetical protein
MDPSGHQFALIENHQRLTHGPLMEQVLEIETDKTTNEKIEQRSPTS